MATAGLFCSVPLILIIFVSTGQTIPSVELTVDQTESELGKSLNLSCESKTGNITGSRIWKGGKHNDVLCLNSVSNFPLRYSEHRVTDQKYNLKIESLSENDLNSPYACHFGFQSDEKIMTVEQIRLIKKPSPEITRTEYVKLNGSYMLSVTLNNVYPVPVCKLIDMHTSKNLTVISEKKDGLFYDIHFMDYSNQPFHSGNSSLTIECTFRTQKYSIFIEHDLEVTSAVSGTNEIKSTPIIVIAAPLTSFIVVLVVVLLIKRKSNFCKKQERSKTLSIDIEGHKENCEPLNHQAHIASMTLPENTNNFYSNSREDKDIMTYMLYPDDMSQSLGNSAHAVPKPGKKEEGIRLIIRQYFNRIIEFGVYYWSCIMSKDSH